MTEGHGTCGQPIVGRKRPQRGRTTSRLAPVRPLWGRLEREGGSYPQVPFPSVIPPAVIHIRPLLLPLHLETSLNELVNGC